MTPGVIVWLLDIGYWLLIGAWLLVFGYFLGAHSKSLLEGACFIAPSNVF